ncbi:MAG: hypothetical protein LBL09_04760 [Oscillospiraceae bacterium]|jgi:hypothetical protein|nr:hypothetical protein [Oscillospiraceae bacterium]
MLSKKWIISVSSVLLVVLLFAGYMAIAAEFGSQGDPLVTLSYIEELIPDLKKSIEDAIAEKTRQFDASIQAKVEEVNQTIDDKIGRFESQYAASFADDEFVGRIADAVMDKMGGSVSSPGPGGEENPASAGNYAGSALFEVVRFETGQTVSTPIGTEILWRIGTATVSGSGSPGLIDITTGEDLAAGKQLQQNHVYVATVKDRGFKCTSGCVILIKGPYTVS